MLKIINSYYYNINNNIYKYLNRVKTMFKINYHLTLFLFCDIIQTSIKK